MGALIVFNYRNQVWITAGKGQDGKVKREARSTDSRDGKISTRVVTRKRVAGQNSDKMWAADNSSPLVPDSQLMAMNKHTWYFVPKTLPPLSKTYVQE